MTTKRATKTPFISVVICTLNGLDRIVPGLHSLQKQSYDKKRCEVIVVDDGGTDELKKNLAKYKFTQVKIVRHKQNLGIGAGRNSGLKKARGTIVAFMDDDCVATRSWLKSISQAFAQDEQAQAVGGKLQQGAQTSWAQRYIYEAGRGLPAPIKKSNSLLNRLKSYIATKYRPFAPFTKRHAVAEVYTYNAAYRKKGLEAIGGFDESLSSHEDVDVSRRLNSLYGNGSVVFDPKPEVSHDNDPSFALFLRKAFRRQKHQAQVAAKAKTLPPIFPFPLVALALIIGAIWQPWLLIAAALSPVVLYNWWVYRAVREKQPRHIVHAYMNFVEESVLVGGLLTAYITRRPAGREPLAPDAYGVPLLLILGLLFLHHMTFFHIPLAIATVLVPGYLLVRSMGVQDRQPWLRGALAGAVGTAWAMAVGLFATSALPMIGISHPLHEAPLFSTFAVSLVVLTWWAAKYPAHIRSWRLSFQNHLAVALYGVAVLLPILSFVGASLLNNGYDNSWLVAMFILAAVSMIATVLRSNTLPRSVFPALLFSISLSALWTYSLRSGVVFGWDIQQEFSVFQNTQAAGIWHLGQAHTQYGAMLSLTVLPTLLANVAGISGGVIFKVGYPMLFSILPVILYFAYRQFAKRWISFSAAVLVVAQFYYLQQFSALARQQVGFIFFAVLLCALLHRSWSERTKKWLGGLAIFGLIVSHYSTTYATISILVTVYLLAKILLLVWRTMWFDELLKREAIVKLWVVAALLLGSLVWYGPATHSASVADSVFRKNFYVQAYQNTETWLKRSVVVSLHLSGAQQEKPSTTHYLSTIGADFQGTKPYLDYYAGASNAGLAAVKTPEIAHRGSLYSLARLGDTVLRYGWWILAIGGTGVLVWAMYRRFDEWHMELTLLVGTGVLLFIAGHLIPAVGTFYNVSRMTEHMLLLAALPAVMVGAWLVKRLMPALQKVVIVGALALSLFYAAGLVTQVTGGSPTANLNNYGSDYQDYYMTDTDMAAANWLGAQYKPGDILYADRYAALRLTTTVSAQRGIFNDVTPETISTNSFVYADTTNTLLGIASANDEGKTVTYQFPATFLETHKNILYNNGSAEIYR